VGKAEVEVGFEVSGIGEKKSNWYVMREVLVGCGKRSRNERLKWKWEVEVGSGSGSNIEVRSGCKPGRGKWKEENSSVGWTCE
jgi:hypothetical protein